MNHARRVACLAAVIGVLSLFTPASPSTAAAGKKTEVDRVPTIQIGDSITVRTSAEIAAMKPDWVLDGRNGREVKFLPARYNIDLADVGGVQPNHWVFELGQNTTAGWSKADYQAVVDRVPNFVEVFFVTTYRDPGLFPKQAPIVQQYAQWMRQIADAQSNVFVIPWRDAVIDGQWQGQPAVLVDGSHPNNASQKTLANMIVHYVNLNG